MLAGHKIFGFGRIARYLPGFTHAQSLGEPPESKHPVLAAARTCRAVAPISELLTKKQQAALVLDRAGFSHREIAQRLRLKHRQSAQQLIARARARQAAIEKASLEMLARV